MPSAAESTVRGAPTSLRELPSIDRVLSLPAVLSLVDQHGRTFVTALARELVAHWRERALAGDALAQGDAAIIAALEDRARRRTASTLRPVYNLTGTVLHTNLGRALLPEAAIAAVTRAMAAPANLEFDVATGERGDRDDLVSGLLCELTGAEAATVVNNNAAAVLLTIAALASRREVLVSRGELVEIGGAFRMPDVMASAGARMVEVGTTNRTHAKDFTGAITPRTGLVMKVHASNYAIQGFTAAVPEPELARIAHDAGVPLAVDLGSGSLVDLAAFGLPREPLPQESLAAGADVVTFSGDKLLGGPQAGLIVGSKAIIARIKKHPLKRALRVSKLTLAALEATLALYRHPEHLVAQLPTLRLLTRPLRDIERIAQRVAPALAHAVGPAFGVERVALQSQIGSGSLPMDVLPSAGIALRPAGKGSGKRIAALAGRLRALPMPVIGRIADGALLLDLRTLEDVDAFIAQLAALAPSVQPRSP